MNIRISNFGLSIISTCLIICLTSCGDLERTLIINPDGSGTLETSIDLGEMMTMMQGMGDMGELINEDVTISEDMEIETWEIDSTTIEEELVEEDKDPIKALMDKITDPAYDQDFDTLFSIAMIMPDSVKEKDTHPELTEKISMRMQSPAKSAALKMGFVFNFDDHQQLRDIINHMETVTSGASTGMMTGAGSDGAISQESFLVFDADMKKGWIRLDTVDYSEFAKSMGMSDSDDESSDDDESLAMLEMMFGNSKIKSIIHVPGEVTSCTNEKAILTKDNRVIIEHGLMDVIRQGEVPGYTIYFTPKK